MLPYGPQSFTGYRLVQEYFAFPERFLFLELTQLRDPIRRCKDEALDIIFLFNRRNQGLLEGVDATLFNLFCTPAINLFQKRADRIHISGKTTEYHIVPDRTRTMDFEVHSVTQVLGFGDQAEPEVEFLPFYQVTDQHSHETGSAFYTLYREQRRLSGKQLRTRSSYVGSNTYLSLVDASEAPYSPNLKQLGVNTLCTNRHLSLRMPLGLGVTDFTLQAGAPYESIRCLAGPTPPRPSNALKDTAWLLISHLALNYLSLTNTDKEQGAAALRQILALYGDASDPTVRKQIAGILSIDSKPVVRRVDLDKRIRAPIPITFARGLELTVSFDELAFKGSGAFLLGAVLDEFLARYVGLNSFTETVVTTTERGEIMRWPARIGKRAVI
jgi:type VI secretion system protein ImpG